MNKLSITILLIVLSFLSVSCNNSDEKQIETVTDSFSEKFFNWKYVDCVPYISPESHFFLRFIATNVTSDNIQTLRSMQDGAKVEIKDIQIFDNDSVAKVTVMLKKICQVDTIGRPAKIYKSAEANILLVKTKTGWKVVVSNDWPKMVNLQQNELLNHDLN